MGRDNIDVYPNGNCVVHHMFGNEVVKTVKNYYEDAYVTAHLEVPGEMFEIAMEKSLEDRGVVGSTSDILNFISKKVQEAIAEDLPTTRRLQFVLGTEAGMVTSIVKSVQEILKAAEGGNNQIEAEIVFPVSSEMVMEDSEDHRLKAHLPPNRLEGKMINGVDAIDLGSEPILFMRHFMQNKAM